jgi:hypothetical protein
MTVTFEQGENNLRNLAAWYVTNINDQNRNEATTRLQLIDRLFFECLGWDQSNCKTEERSQSTITDYSFFSANALRLLIVEAKREGIYFELPTGQPKLKVKLHYFIEHSKEIANAIEQAAAYSQNRGTPFGSICNGHQLIAFIASRNDGKYPLDGMALVFDSLDTLLANFLIAWQCLSPTGIAERRLGEELQDTISAPVPEKLSVTIPNYPRYRRRNALQTELQILSGLFIEGFTKISANIDERRALKEIYCESGALSQYAAVSKDLLRSRYSDQFQEAAQLSYMEPATSKKGINPDILEQHWANAPIILIGERGVGKTTFIKHLYLTDETDAFKDAIVIYLDFGSKPTIAEDLNKYVFDDIERELLVNYDININDRNFVYGVLNKEVHMFEKGPWGDVKESNNVLYLEKRAEFIAEKQKDKERYLQASISHLVRGRKKKVAIFLDNVDQRDDVFQEKVFLIGQSMAASWPVNVFVSIRPETFYRSRVSGTFSAYHARAFTISPPRVDQVVSKRLSFGLKLLQEGAPLRLGHEVEVHVTADDLQNYVKILIYSFERNGWLVEFLENMCGGNIRLALDFVREFIGSGHVNTEEMLTIFRASGAYTVALHQFLRAVTYGDYEDYSPNMSELINLFDVSTPDPHEHFLSAILLNHMDHWAHFNQASGYVSLSDIHTYLQSNGYQPSQIRWHLNRLLQRNLIEQASKTREISDLSVPYFRITSVGAYYVKRLIGMFAYVDAMIVDTPITDSDWRAKITQAYNIKDRLTRAMIFINYLDSAWGQENPTGKEFDWKFISLLIRKDIQYINSKASAKEHDIIPPPMVNEE